MISIDWHMKLCPGDFYSWACCGANYPELSEGADYQFVVIVCVHTPAWLRVCRAILRALTYPHVVRTVFSHPPSPKTDFLTWVEQLSAALALARAVAWVSASADYQWSLGDLGMEVN